MTWTATTIVDIPLSWPQHEEQARRLLCLGDAILAYGIAEELIYCGSGGAGAGVASHSENEKGGSDEAAAPPTVPTVIRSWEDEVKAIAVSDDGKRVAVGFAAGETWVYVYEHYNPQLTPWTSHPFIRRNEDKDGKNDDDDTANSYFVGKQFSCQVRDLQFLPNSYWLVIATEDVYGEGLSVCDATNQSTMQAESYLATEAGEHHDGGVRAVTVCSLKGRTNDQTFISSLGMDGRHCLWDLTPKNPRQWKLIHREGSLAVTKKDVGESLASDAWDRSCRPAFVRGEALLCLPGEPFLQLRNLVPSRDDKTPQECNHLDTPHTDVIVAIAAWRDRAVVTSARDGRVVLWAIQNGMPKIVTELLRLESPATHMTWDSAGNLYVVSATGQVKMVPSVINSLPSSTTTSGKLEKVVPEDSKSNKSKLRRLGIVKESMKAPENSGHGGKSNGSTGHGMDNGHYGTDDDDDNVQFETQQRITTNSSSGYTSKFIDDEAADDTGSIAGGSEMVDRKTSYGDEDSNDDEIDNAAGDQGDDDGSTQESVEDYAEPRMENFHHTKSTPPQAAFAPSSTPLTLPHRFLCWNHIGSITLHQGEVHGTVNIHFTASATRRPVSFTDNLGFIVGSLGEDGAIFCTDRESPDEGDDGENHPELVVGKIRMKATAAILKKKKITNGSTIYFHRFETIGALRDKDWYLTLPNGERAVGCATGEGWAAVITSRRFLRLFSSGGNQCIVLWLEGEPVTIVGRGRFLAVFYHVSTPLPDGTQKLGYLLYDALAHQTISKAAVSCVSSGASLTWAGFCNIGSLLAMDSEGLLSMLVATSKESWEWMPMLDTVGLRKSSDDSYWPINAVDGKLVCIPLKGGIKYPDATRKPVTSVLGFRMPLVQGAMSKVNAIEELSVRAGVALNQKRLIHDIIVGDEEDEDFEREYLTLSAQVDKVVLKVFAATVEAGKMDRALDLVERLHLEKSYELAMVLARNHRRLSDSIEDAKFRRFGLPGVENLPEPTDIDFWQRVSPDVPDMKRSFHMDAKSARNVRARKAFS